MTTIVELAKDVGAPGRRARSLANRLDITTQDRKGYIPLAERDAERLTAVLRGDVSHDDDSEPGLPLSALGDPAFREAFTLLRWQRERRLHEHLWGF